jgi:DNA-binding response OmpR family regulator
MRIYQKLPKFRKNLPGSLYNPHWKADQELTQVWSIMAKATILVVEDDRNLMQGICDILELQEYRVLTAANGLGGLDVMNSCTPPPDLIVSDIMMPGMNGYEFFEAVRNDERWMTIPFIFLTAKSEKADVRAGKSMGADDYVIKPFDAEDLVIAVDAKLRRSKELDRVRDLHISDIKRQIMIILNHEFRTPLTFVVAYADMLHRDADELSYDEIKTFLNGVNAGADRLRRLIENFILLVELETGEAVRTFGWRKRPFCDYQALFAEAMTRAQEMAKTSRRQSSAWLTMRLSSATSHKASSFFPLTAKTGWCA